MTPNCNAESWLPCSLCVICLLLFPCHCSNRLVCSWRVFLPPPSPPRLRPTSACCLSCGVQHVCDQLSHNPIYGASGLKNRDSFFGGGADRECRRGVGIPLQSVDVGYGLVVCATVAPHLTIVARSVCGNCGPCALSRFLLRRRRRRQVAVLRLSLNSFKPTCVSLVLQLTLTLVCAILQNFDSSWEEDFSSEEEQPVSSAAVRPVHGWVS